MAHETPNHTGMNGNGVRGLPKSHASLKGFRRPATKEITLQTSGLFQLGPPESLRTG